MGSGLKASKVGVCFCIPHEGLCSGLLMNAPDLFRVQLDFGRPEKPTENAFIESFNGLLRDECLNQHWFLSLDEARAVTEAWRDD